jgi:4-hydroxy-3-polyprenylbenzoate decarboxylase
LVIGMSGATGVVYGIRLLEVLRETDVETHLVMSKWAQQTLEHETDRNVADVRDLADHAYAPGDMAAAISSGSFETMGMAIVPCSMRTLGAVAHGYGDTLVHRAADVVLKERRKLVIVPRETPLGEVHLENMLKLTRMGAVVLPPMPAFYNHPQSIGDIVDHLVARLCDQFGIATDLSERWQGEMRRANGVVKLRPAD